LLPPESAISGPDFFLIGPISGQFNKINLKF
jgi:hypothetical protein